MQRLSEYAEIGEIIGKCAFVPGDMATAADFARRKRGEKSPYLSGVKEICAASGHNRTARGMIRLYCDMRDTENIELFRAHYVNGENLYDIAQKIYDEYPEYLIKEEDKTGKNFFENIRRGLNRKIDNVQRDFAVWLSNVIPLWLGASAPVVPEKLPCGGNKAVMRGNCKRCFFCNMGICEG